MKIEEGKFYLNREGFPVGPMQRSSEPDSHQYPWNGYSEINGDSSFTEDGLFWSGDPVESQMDLVEEWIDHSVLASQAADHIADLLMRDDGQAHKEARKFLALHFPEVIEKHNL